MDKQVIVINYGELNLKGKNRKDFVNKLISNLKRALLAYKDHIIVKITHDHSYLYLNDIDKTQLESIVDSIKDVSGIYSFGVGVEVESNPDTIIAKALELVKKHDNPLGTFKVISKRIDKAFYPISEQLNRDVATQILKNTQHRVDVHNPLIPLNIKIYPEATYIYYREERGAGGLPLGTGKKALMLISGGIDSPVAAYYLMKRGVSLDFIHFASPPYTSSGVIDKIRDMLKVLNKYQSHINLYVVPFTKVQEKIYEVSDESYAITILRRKMYIIASKLAEKKHCLALANGENIGQVASQTLDSINVINEVTNLAVIRPLITFDKNEIIDAARKIGTYEISIRPFTDCCTIFAPINPKTSPKLPDVLRQEAKADYTQLIEEALDSVELIRVNFEDQNDIEKFL